MTTRDLEHQLPTESPVAEPTRRHLLVVALSSAGLVAAVMQTVVLPLIPTLPQIVHAAPSDASWVITATLLSASVSTPVAGRFGDMFGKRRTLLGVLVLMVVGAVVSALSDSLLPMIVGRALQGTAMGAIPLGISLMRDLLPHRHRAAAISFLSSTLGMGSALGLPLAAVTIEGLGWHAVFWGSALLGVLSAVLIVVVVPESPVRSPGRVDVPGVLGLVTGLTALLLVISKGTTWGWTSPAVLGLAATAVVVFPVWGWHELRRRGPLVDLRVSARRPVLLTNAASVMVGFALYSSMLLFPQVLQSPVGTGFGQGHSLVVAGLLMAPSGLVMLVASPLSARLIDARGARVTLLCGIAVLAAACLMAPFMLDRAWQIVAVSVILGTGMAIGYSAMPTLIMNAVPEHETGAANGLNTLMRSVGTALASAVMAAVLTETLAAAAAGERHGGAAFTVGFLVAGGVAVLGFVLALALPRAVRT
jgi:MFS family permease